MFEKSLTFLNFRFKNDSKLEKVKKINANPEFQYLH